MPNKIQFSTVTDTAVGISLTADRIELAMNGDRYLILAGLDTIDMGSMLRQICQQVEEQGGSTAYVSATAGNSAHDRMDMIQGAVESDADYVFIEHPETYLHPCTQEYLGNWLDDTAKNGGKHIIICSHAPTVIGDHWNRVIELTHLEGGEAANKKYEEYYPWARDTE